MSIISEINKNVTKKIYKLNKGLPDPANASLKQSDKVVVSQRFEVHKKSVKFIENTKSISSKREVACRGRVTDFTYKSMERMKYTLEDCLDSLNFVLVLTYPKTFPTDGLKVRRDREAFLRWLKRQGVTSYFWLQEFQLRGAPHLHMMLSKAVNKYLCQLAWYKIVQSGDLYHLAQGVYFDVVQDKEKLGNYFIAHATKQGQKELPENYNNSGRWWGCSTDFTCKPKRIIQVGHSNNDTAQAFKLPLVLEHKNNMLSWSKVKEKNDVVSPGTSSLTENIELPAWQDYGYGFNAWGVADKIDNLIIEGSRIASKYGNFEVKTLLEDDTNINMEVSSNEEK